MERPSSLRTTTRGFLLPYRWGEHKWEDHLLDTQSLIYDGAQAQVDATTGLRLVVEAGNAQQAEMLRAFQQHAADSGVAWNRIADQLNGLDDTLVSGFTTLANTLDFHAELLEVIAGKLDLIVFVLEHPLDTEAKELFHSGRKLLERRLYPEALADFQASEARRPVNPVLQLHIAQLHYYIRDDAVPFNYAIAEEHIALAIRYGRALQGDLGPSGKQIVDLVCRTAAHIALVKGGDAANQGDLTAGKTELIRSRAILQTIDNPSPSSRFLAAQVTALLGNSEDAVDRIRSLADYTRAWIPRALLQPDLSSVAGEIGKLAAQLALDPGPHSQAVREAVGTGRQFNRDAVSTEVASPTHCAHLEAEADRTLARFESGDVDASAAREKIISELDATRRAIRAGLNEAFERCDTAALLHGSVASEMAAKARRLPERFEISTALAIGAFFGIPCAFATLLRGNSHLFFPVLFLCGGFAIAVLSCFWLKGRNDHYRRCMQFSAKAKEADGLARANRGSADAFNQRLETLSRVEAELKLTSGLVDVST